jgi:23S rRNA (cytidine1920-2'-O)/16S rRNA (cytidine1409-2'-O)-methyltransferase
VTVDGAPALKSSTQVHAGQALVVAAPPRAYVSRGGEKLAHGLDRFAVDPSGRRCLDAGVSTGGFTDCLLQRGAGSVLAYDVGYGQVHERIRQDDRVEVHERTNVRDLRPEDLPPPLPDLLVADLSFISLAGAAPDAAGAGHGRRRGGGPRQAAVRSRSGPTSARAVWCATPPCGDGACSAWRMRPRR